jgi:hypothetical protein
VLKAQIVKLLRLCSSLDETSSPFIGCKLQNEKFDFFRSSSLGSIISPDYSSNLATPIYVSLSHFLSSLRVFPDLEILTEVEKNGVLKLSSSEGSYDNEVRVYTVAEAKTGLKIHNTGVKKLAIDPLLFSGFSSSKFTLAHPPILKESSIMLATSSGVVVWQGPAELKNIPLSPRSHFLDFIDENIKEIYLSDKGYWSASTEEAHFTHAAHDSGAGLFQIYKTPGQKIEEFPAARLIFAIQAAQTLSNDTNKIEVDPVLGVLTKDLTGNVSKFSLGTNGKWGRFTIVNKTAKVIVDGLSMSSEDVVSLESLPSLQVYRLVRGNWSINFKVF